MNISREDIKGLRFKYKEAIKAGKDSFEYKGHTFLVSYAEYLLQYLETLKDEGIDVNNFSGAMVATNNLQHIKNARMEDLVIVVKNVLGKSRHIVCMNHPEGMIPMFIAVDDDLFNAIKNDH